jgi:hypothetical protein
VGSKNQNDGRSWRPLGTDHRRIATTRACGIARKRLAPIEASGLARQHRGAGRSLPVGGVDPGAESVELRLQAPDRGGVPAVGVPTGDLPAHALQ